MPSQLIRVARYLVIFGCVLLPAMAQGEESSLALDEDMKYFYKHPTPELAAQALIRFNKSPFVDKPGAHPPLIGFLAGVFQRYPQDIDKMIPADLADRVRLSVSVALQLAGQNERARFMIQRVSLNGVHATDLDSTPRSLDAIPVVGATEFDLMWGASFATGDPRYCLKIISRFASVANVDKNADDMVEIVKAFAAKTDLRWLVAKRGRDNAHELAIVSSALWGLESNARQHEFVRTALDGYINLHRQEPAAKALQAVKTAF